MQERQGDRRPPAAATCRSRSPTSTRRSRRARTRSTVDPRLRPGRAARDPAGDGGRRQGRAVGRRPGRRRPARTTSATSTGTRRYAGTMWAQWMVKAAARQGQRHLPRRPGRQPGRRRRSSRAIVKVFEKHPGMKLLTGNKSLARHELGSGDGAEGHGGAARQVPEDRRDHLRTTAPTRSPRPARSRRPAASSCRSRRSTRTASPASTRRTGTRRSRRSRPATGSAAIAARKAIAAAEGLPNKRAEPLQARRSSRTRCTGKPLPVRRRALRPTSIRRTSSRWRQIAKYGKP